MSSGAQKLLTLEEVAKLFADWRDTRPRKCQIPESLWKAVARLEPQQSIVKTGKALSLNCALLKTKMKEFGTAQASVTDSNGVNRQKPRARSQTSFQVTKIVAVEKPSSDESASVEIVSPSGWTLRSTCTIRQPQILEFARAVSLVTT